MYFRISSHISYGQNIVISVLTDHLETDHLETDHLEWEVFNVELTILNGKLVALDHYIPIGLLYY